MSENKVINLSDYTGDSLECSGEQALEETLQWVKAGEFPGNVIIIGIDKKRDGFIAQWLSAGVLSSDALAAMEIVKADIISFLRGENG